MQINEFGTILNLALLLAAYLVLQPLKAQIANLAKSLDLMSAVIGKLQETLNNEQRHIAQMDEIIRSLQRRVDNLEKHDEELQQRCITCHCNGE